MKLESLTHDVPNYCIHFEINKQKGIYITDTCSVENINAKNYNLYLVESNYNEDLLKQHILECDDIYKLKYLERVPKTHLSYEKANTFLIENMGDNSNFQYIHQSEYNFREEKLENENN